MSNHVHLLIETGEIPLSKIMHGLQFAYIRYFNRKYRKVGHLFQGRFKAILCDREAYLLELVRYLHLKSGTHPFSGGPVEVSMEQPRGVFGQGQLGEGGNLSGSWGNSPNP